MKKQLDGGLSAEIAPKIFKSKFRKYFLVLCILARRSCVPTFTRIKENRKRTFSRDTISWQGKGPDPLGQGPKGLDPTQPSDGTHETDAIPRLLGSMVRHDNSTSRNEMKNRPTTENVHPITIKT